MKTSNRKILIEQLDRKFSKLSNFSESEIPSKGWVYSIRRGMSMSLSQIAKKLGKSVPTIKEIEEREENKTITLKKLMEVAEALDMRFVYGFIPKEGTLEAMIEKRAFEVAREIVMHTSHTMKLEDQEVRKDRLEKAIKDRAEKIKQEKPRLLWD